MATSANSLQLNDVKQSFDSWRSRSKIDEEIPISLWQQVGAIGGHYSISHICKALKITYYQYRQYFDSLSAPTKIITPDKKTACNTTAFIELPKEVAYAASHQDKASIELTRPDGTRMLIRHASEQQMNQWFTLYLEGNK